MEIIKQFWHQILFLGLIVILFTRLREQVHELRKDVDAMQNRHLYAKFVKVRAETDVLNKQVTSLWQFVNDLRDRFGNNK